MTIQITKPEVEALINLRLRTGAFKDAEDVILQALQTSPVPEPGAASRYKNLAEMFEAARGLGDDLDVSRNPSFGRPVVLS
jgi:hypothetical protein